MANYLTPILLLIGSNVFMTFAWYGHLKFTDRPLWLVIFVSWGKVMRMTLPQLTKTSRCACSWRFRCCISARR